MMIGQLGDMSPVLYMLGAAYLVLIVIYTLFHNQNHDE